MAKARRLQNISCVLMQDQGMRRWFETPPRLEVSHRVLGFSMMWDEASQKRRALLTRLAELANAQTTTYTKDVQVLTTMGSVRMMRAAESEDGEVRRQYRWYPWLALLGWG